MVLVISIAYPLGSKFDMDYYLKHHMPLVQKVWASHGLKSWKVAQYTNSDSPFAVQAWLEWEDGASWDAASTVPDAKEIFADIPNFSDHGPVRLAGSVTGSASW
ncbi:hypothetical protein F4804DRAFT_249521 [Jackrogersella minutella]|nr:hypothetical protein F4804DRAFT_249521 [Jackrogersella minutella]